MTAIWSKLGSRASFPSGPCKNGAGFHPSVSRRAGSPGSTVQDCPSRRQVSWRPGSQTPSGSLVTLELPANTDCSPIALPQLIWGSVQPWLSLVCPSPRWAGPRFRTQRGRFLHQ